MTTQNETENVVETQDGESEGAVIVLPKKLAVAVLEMPELLHLKDLIKVHYGAADTVDSFFFAGFKITCLFLYLRHIVVSRS